MAHVTFFMKNRAIEVSKVTNFFFCFALLMTFIDLTALHLSHSYLTVTIEIRRKIYFSLIFQQLFSLSLSKFILLILISKMLFEILFTENLITI